MDDSDDITVGEAREIVAAHEGKFSLKCPLLLARIDPSKGMASLNDIRSGSSFDMSLILKPLNLFQGHIIRDIDALESERADVLRQFFAMKKGLRTRMNALMKRVDESFLPEGRVEGLRTTIIAIEIYLFAFHRLIERTLYRGSISAKSPSSVRLKGMADSIVFSREAAEDSFRRIESSLGD